MLRIAHRHSSERCLVRGFHGQIVDVAFANILREVIIAVVDELGSAYVYAVHLAADSKIKYPFLHQFALTVGVLHSTCLNWVKGVYIIRFCCCCCFWLLFCFSGDYYMLGWVTV